VKHLDPTTSGRQAALGVFWGTVERVATQGISFLVVLILARILGPETYGLVTLAATIALLGQMLLGETFSHALIQHKRVEREHISSLFWILLGGGVLAAMAQILLAGALARAFGVAGLAPILRGLSPLPLFSALQAVPIAMFKRQLDFRTLTGASATGTVLGGIVGVSLAYAGFGPWSLVGNLLVQNAAITIAVWRRSPLRPHSAFSSSALGELWSYGQYTFLVRLAAFAANQSPRILVGYLFGPAALGAFSLGLRVVEILYQLLVMPAVNVAVPVIAKVREDPIRLTRAILTATQLAAMICVPVFVALALVAPVLMPLAFGAKWNASIPIVQIMCLYGIVGTCGLIWNSIIAGLGRPHVTLATTTAAAVIGVSVLLLTARWGLVAASTAFVIRGYLTLPFMPLVIARLTAVPPATQYRVFIPIIIAASIMAFAIEVTLVALHVVLTPLALLSAAATVAVGVYAVALSVVARPALKLGASFFAQLRPRQDPVRP
jgi:PST family polysaccharide transporter